MQSSIYEQYAPFYDGSGQIRFALLFGQYLAEVLDRHPVAGRRALDLACGTGTLALELADSGWDICGVDQSRAMVALATARAHSANTVDRVRFVVGDMRDLPGLVTRGVLVPPFDLITCTYDSLNYLLTDADLATCVRGVAQLLAPNGVFIADMNTLAFLEHDWGACEVIERPGFVQVNHSTFDRASGCSTMRLTGFAGDDASGYQRFDEIHIERGYPIETVAACLTDAGLQLEGCYDCFTFARPYPASQRIAWVARRGSVP